MTALARIVQPPVVDVEVEPARSFSLRIDFPDLPGGGYGRRYRSASIDHDGRVTLSGELSVAELSFANDVARLGEKFLGRRKRSNP